MCFYTHNFSLQGTRYEVGDIVSILDENGGVYYALLRGFLEDQYAEKYAALTWLIPTTPNPRDFDPSLFVLGKHHSHYNNSLHKPLNKGRVSLEEVKH